MWIAQPVKFDMGQHQALSMAVPFEILQFVAVLLLISAALALMTYLVGLLLLCRDDNRAVAQVPFPQASRQQSDTTPKQPRRLRPAQHTSQTLLQQKERP